VTGRAAGFLLLVCFALHAQTESSRVLIVANETAPVSRTIAEYYSRARGVPATQVCRLKTTTDEEISREVYDRDIAIPVARFLRQHGLIESIYHIVLTSGVPLKIRGTDGAGGTCASVDSELTLLYQDLRGIPHRVPGLIPNPYYRSEEPFSHPRFPMYLVTRLAAYDFADVRGMIERGKAAVNRGIVVLDQRENEDTGGDEWLRRAASKLPQDRVLLESTKQVVEGAKDVIGYASWGSNDKSRKNRDPHFTFLPGALVTEYVSTDGRTFMEPPASWNLGTWINPLSHFAGSPQSLAADYIRYGATGISGHVYEPFLSSTPRPDMLFPAWLGGRNLAESFWCAISSVSWQSVVAGDPLARLQPVSRDDH
jgi:uncharacterized protein (TIGR03790 family)